MRQGARMEKYKCGARARQNSHFARVAVRHVMLGHTTWKENGLAALEVIVEVQNPRHQGTLFGRKLNNFSDNQNGAKQQK